MATMPLLEAASALGHGNLLLPVRGQEAHLRTFQHGRRLLQFLLQALRRGNELLD